MKLLIIGGDSLVGAALSREASASRWSGRATTRRGDVGGMLHWDLSAPARCALPEERFDCAVLCAAMSRHDQCAADPTGAQRVNVEAPVHLALELMARGTHVIFLSTDSVFGEHNGRRGEGDEVHPGTRTYPTLKAQAEALLLDTTPTDQLTILRLTKVVSARRQPFGSWCQALRDGGRVEGFSDLVFSPISLRHTVRSIMSLCMARAAGVFHLSGSRDLSYAEFAALLSAGSDSPVWARTASEAGVSLAFRPAYSCLGMKQTSRVMGFQPQPPEAVAEDLRVEYARLHPEKDGVKA